MNSITCERQKSKRPPGKPPMAKTGGGYSKGPRICQLETGRLRANCQNLSNNLGSISARTKLKFFHLLREAEHFRVPRALPLFVPRLLTVVDAAICGENASVTVEPIANANEEGIRGCPLARCSFSSRLRCSCSLGRVSKNRIGLARCNLNCRSCLPTRCSVQCVVSPRRLLGCFVSSSVVLLCG